jgi:NAD(P)-dependent dehydrogenase (short-subunit alcohol dehydrogenase family)
LIDSPAARVLVGPGFSQKKQSDEEMPMLLEGKVAVVTGAGRGIGRGIALCLAKEGAKVVVNDPGSTVDGRGKEGDPAHDVAEEIKKAGGQAVPNYDSVADFAAAGRIIQTALDSFGRIDILVNNAGILRDARIIKMTEEDFDGVIAVHLKGTFNTARHAFPKMMEQSYGRIINITSSAGLRGNFGQSNYSAAKAGIMGLTFTWALEGAKYGITANAMAPAGLTRMVGTIPGMAGKPIPPEMSPELNAPLVAFLASEKAAHVNGQVFGRRGFAFTIFQTPRPIASMYKPGGLSPEEVAANFDGVFAEHLQPVGIPQMRRDAAPEKK